MFSIIGEKLIIYAQKFDCKKLSISRNGLFLSKKEILQFLTNNNLI